MADLQRMAADSAAFGADLSMALETRIRELVERIAANPEIGARVVERPGAHVVPLIRYPFKIFYRVLDGGGVRILHVRHTARRPWKPAR